MTTTRSSNTDNPTPLKVRSVAVIGAGISGVCAAAHAIRQGLSVTLFERSDVAGGIWHYDPRVPAEPPYPNELPSRGDYKVSTAGQFRYPTPPPQPPTLTSSQRDKSNAQAPVSERGEKISSTTNGYRKDGETLADVHFAPPGPCYAGLKNNVPTTLMYSLLGSWESGTEEYVGHNHLAAYIQRLALDTGVHASANFNTRVDDVRKSLDGRHWEVRALRLENDRLSENFQTFDAVVVATGHYNMARIPDIPGLRDWKEASVLGDVRAAVIHSKSYRAPGPFSGKRVLVVGGGVSSLDICKELSGTAAKVYQSTRGGKYDLPATMLPEGVERVCSITEFICGLEDNVQPPPGPEVRQRSQNSNSQIKLSSGATLYNIDAVILATGYVTSYPCLRHLHSDTAVAKKAGHELLVTSEGDMTHNLHRDIFYIEDPTLVFVGVPYHVATFSLFDFQAALVARVLAGKAVLPDHAAMRAEYEAKKAERGLSRDFHSLRASGAEIAYVDELVRWANRDAETFGHGDYMEGHSKEWKRTYWDIKEKRMKLLGLAF